MIGGRFSSPLLKKLESGLLMTGAVLLSAFFVVKSWSVAERQNGIDAFELNKAAARTAPSMPHQDGDHPTRVTSVSWEEPQPDFSLWSDQRILDYQASLQQTADTPQALLTIDHLDIRVPVYNGATDLNLNRGVARIIGTGRIGAAGNLGIAGHRDGFFRPLKDIRVGDHMVLDTYAGTEKYTVTSIDIVDPSQLEVLAPTEVPTVTLVTCYPFYYVGHAPKRFIVKGEVRSQQVRPLKEET